MRGNPLGCRSLAYLRRLVGAGRMGARRVGHRFAASRQHYALSPGPGFAQRAVATGGKLRLRTPANRTAYWPTEKRWTYMVYKVFTVFWGPPIVHNLLNLC